MLDEVGFRGQVEEAQAAIDRGDVLGHGTAWRTLKAQLPCLDGPPPVEPWARFLVGYAVVEHALGRDWEPALRTALRIDPDVARDYGPEALRTYVAPADDDPLVSLADGVWIDGVSMTATGALAGPHIVQRERSGSWTTVVVTDGPVPAGWEASAGPDLTRVVPDPVTEPAPTGVARPRRGKALRITGWSLAGLGVLGAAGTGLYTVEAVRDPDGDDSWSETEVQVVRGANMGAWGLGAVGLGLAVVGHVQGGRSVSVAASPGGLGVRVRR